MDETEKINVFWFRHDLRLEDNTGLIASLNQNLPVLLLFIFDTDLISGLPISDSRITFIHDRLHGLNNHLAKYHSSILVKKGNPVKVWEEIISEFRINSVFVNRVYEPYDIGLDLKIHQLLLKKGIRMLSFKDLVIFEENDLMTVTGKPYTLFTPYRNRWIREYTLKRLEFKSQDLPSKINLFKSVIPLQSLNEIGFRHSLVSVRHFDLSCIREYDKYRDFPVADRTTYLGPHLRYGTVSIRKIVKKAAEENHVFLGELIWREFFMQILYNFPQVVTGNFRSKYNGINWRNNEKEFRRWCAGETGYPIVDAGIRQLNETGYMHNRVRMITAGFLCKHLLTAWWFGEAYFAEKLLDYELSSNNGNWQWIAGTGCDAAQYFRVFNPNLQQKKYDPQNEYVRKWVPEFDKSTYPKPIVEHEFARLRAIRAYKESSA